MLLAITRWGHGLPRLIKSSHRRLLGCNAQASLDYKPLQTRQAQHGTAQQVLDPEPDLGGAGELRTTPSLDAEQPHHRVWSTAAAEKALAASLLGLACVAFDVFSPSSLHLLSAVDAAMHAWVAEQLPAGSPQHWVARYIVSDFAIVAGLLCWVGAAAYAVLAPAAGSGNSSSSSGSRGARTAQAMLLCTLAYGVGGAYKGGDPLAVDFLKHAFQRLRPFHHLHRTFSFPSGHTTAAVFIVGGWLRRAAPLLRSR
jgi:hypothetical protein